MRHSLLTACLILLLVVPLLAVNNRSVSGSQQFTVICDDRALRQNLASAFDEVRTGLFTELSVKLGAPTPIYVRITPRKIVEYNASTSTLRWLDAPDGARVQLDILVDDDMQEPRLQEHIISALLLTLKYRDNPPKGGQAYSEPPGWLVEGLSEKIRLQTKEPDATLYRGLLNAKKLPDLAEWMRVDPAKLDVTTLGIYRAYACALVSYFQGEPNGNRKLLDFLQKAPTDPAAAVAWLRKNFPALGNDGRNLSKWWSLSLAKLSAADRYTAWGGPDTDTALDKALTLHLSDGEAKKTYTLDEFADFLPLPGTPVALATLRTDLIRLALRAHPLYRPVIQGYLDTVDQLQHGKTKDLDRKLADLADLRTQLTRRLQEVSDYLTWFAATQANQSGPGEFDSYFRLMEANRAPRPPSKEPIGQYLDAMEAELRD